MKRGLATGVGSLPFKDPAAAVDFVLKNVPQAPFWPQLPRRDIREGMVAQYSENLPCVKVAQDGVFFDGRDCDKKLEAFYDRLIADDTGYFAISKAFAAGLHAFYERLKAADLSAVEYIKLHITGPFTFAASLTDDKQLALVNDEVFMQAFIKGLAMKGLWQAQLFGEFGKPMIIFLDEPYLGCFGSAYTPVTREQAVAGLTEICSTLAKPELLVGVHCCGNTDWSIFTDVKEIKIINFDAYEFLDKVVLYAKELAGFFERGGVLCWGIVPTREFSDTLDAGTLLRKIDAGIKALEKKGVSAETARRQMMVSPACGLGALDEARAAGIFGMLGQVSLALGKA